MFKSEFLCANRTPRLTVMLDGTLGDALKRIVLRFDCFKVWLTSEKPEAGGLYHIYY